MRKRERGAEGSDSSVVAAPEGAGEDVGAAVALRSLSDAQRLVVGDQVSGWWRMLMPLGVYRCVSYEPLVMAFLSVVSLR